MAPGWGSLRPDLCIPLRHLPVSTGGSCTGCAVGGALHQMVHGVEAGDAAAAADVQRRIRIYRSNPRHVLKAMIRAYDASIRASLMVPSRTSPSMRSMVVATMPGSKTCCWAMVSTSTPAVIASRSASW